MQAAHWQIYVFIINILSILNHMYINLTFNVNYLYCINF
jgi:hypothetical protein